MKRNILSILLACLMIVSLCMMVGCNTDELEAQIMENDAKQEGAVSDLAADLESDIKSAADTAAANLAAAQKKLETMISGGDAVDAAALKAATEEFNAALAATQDALDATVDAAVEDATDAYVALEASLEKAIDDAVAAVAAATEKKIGNLDAALKDAIATGDADLSAKVTSVAEELALLQENVLRDMVALDTIAKQDLTDKFNATIEEIYYDLCEYIGEVVVYLEELIDENAEEDASVEELNTAVDTLNAAIEAAKKVAADANDALKAELETAIANAVNTAKTELTNNLNTKVTELQKAIKDNADADASVEELNAAKTALENFAKAQDTALKTVLETAIANAVNAAKTELTNNLNAKVTELQNAINSNADTDASIEELNAAKTALENFAKAQDTALKTELLGVINNVDKRVTDIINGWKEGTDAAASAIITINDIFWTLGSDIDASATAALDTYFEITKVRVIRALTADEVNDIVAEYKETMAALTTVSDTYNAIDLDLYDAAAQEELNDLFTAAVDEIIAADENVDIDELVAAFVENVANVPTV